MLAFWSVQKERQKRRFILKGEDGVRLGSCLTRKIGAIPPDHEKLMREIEDDAVRRGYEITSIFIASG